jgi:histidinol-phosphate aminotransferase
VSGVEPVRGRDRAAALEGGGRHGAATVDLAWNENPWGPSPRALSAARRALALTHRYADALRPSLRERLAARLGVDEDSVLLGAGSSELIGLCVQAFCGPLDEVLAPAFSFACYRMSCEGQRRPYREAPAAPGFATDVEALCAAATPATRVVFLANPNNPTGLYVSRPELEGLLDRMPAHVVVVVDEAYGDYVGADDYPDAVRLRGGRERLIALRTFSKIHGLAGMRIGYAVGPPALLAQLEACRLPFSVNTVAQAAARAALDDAEHVARSRRVNTAERARLTEALRAAGLVVMPSQANFVLAGLARRQGDAHAFTQALLRRGVAVRGMDGYGLPGHVRITVGTEADNTRLLSAIHGILGL